MPWPGADRVAGQPSRSSLPSPVVEDARCMLGCRHTVYRTYGPGGAKQHRHPRPDGVLPTGVSSKSEHLSQVVHALHCDVPGGPGLTVARRLGLTGRETRQIDSGVLVPIVERPAAGAGPVAVREGEGLVHLLAAGAGFRAGIPAVSEPQVTAVPVRLVGELAAYLPGRRVRPGLAVRADTGGRAAVPPDPR